MSDRAAPACIILGHRRRTLAHLRAFDMYVELCSQRPVHAHGVAERMRRTCAACVYIYGGCARRRCVWRCVPCTPRLAISPALHLLESSSPPSPLYQPSAQPSAHSPPPIVLSAQPSAPTCTTWHSLARSPFARPTILSPNYTPQPSAPGSSGDDGTWPSAASAWYIVRVRGL